MNLNIPLVALAVIAAATVLIPEDAPKPPVHTEVRQMPVASIDSMANYLSSMQQATSRAPEPPWASIQLTAQGQETNRQFEQLRNLPRGDAAITLSRQLEAGITSENLGAYLHALLSTDNSSVERVAISALARVADARTMVELAGYYGSLTPQLRGRILSVLESAENPEAASGLAAIVAADTNEKRSPVMMSALYGIANTGSAENVQYLLEQMSTDNVEYAVMALERVRSAQGVQMIRAAAEGSKDLDLLAAAYQPALRRIAEAAERQ